MMIAKKLTLVSLALVLASCGGDSNSIPTTAPPPPPPAPTPAEILISTIEDAANGGGLASFILPDSNDFENIPQDPRNPITAEKVLLGQMLFHDTAIGTEGVNGGLDGTWSCATCHHASAGFKSGLIQAIGEGGSGFGENGSARVLAAGFDRASTDATMVPDVQMFTSPTVLNSAYQEVIFWNGAFGAAVNGVVNNDIPIEILGNEAALVRENRRGFAGLETQAIAGQTEHRLRTTNGSVLQTNPTYVEMYNAAYPDGYEDAAEGAALAIAAFQRTVLANEAPFQRWLKGESDAMSDDEIAGATLFFGKAGCTDCHRGAGLSSEVGATESEMFFAVGFADMDRNDPRVSGDIIDLVGLGRAAFTQQPEDAYMFKIPPLYNLKDTTVFGHGGSFTSVRDVVAYKNAAVSQRALPIAALDPRFQPLGLTEQEIDQLTLFLEESLYDPNLSRYQPESVPSGACLIVGDEASRQEMGC